jgi:hypothetical protein
MTADAYSKAIARARRMATRKRSAVACARCRAMKIKCSDSRPCKHCVLLESSCIEVDEPRDKKHINMSVSRETPSFTSPNQGSGYELSSDMSLAQIKASSFSREYFIAESPQPTCMPPTHLFGQYMTSTMLENQRLPHVYADPGKHGRTPLHAMGAYSQEPLPWRHQATSPCLSLGMSSLPLLPPLMAASGPPRNLPALATVLPVLSSPLFLPRPRNFPSAPV